MHATFTVATRWRCKTTDFSLAWAIEVCNCRKPPINNVSSTSSWRLNKLKIELVYIVGNTHINCIREQLWIQKKKKFAFRPKPAKENTEEYGECFNKQLLHLIQIWLNKVNLTTDRGGTFYRLVRDCQEHLLREMIWLESMNLCRRVRGNKRSKR